MKFRKIEIKELTPISPPTGPSADLQGWVPLFNGKDETRLEDASRRSRATGDVENGVLIGSGVRHLSHLYTERDDFKDLSVAPKGTRQWPWWRRSMFPHVSTVPSSHQGYPSGFGARIRSRIEATSQEVFGRFRVAS